MRKSLKALIMIAAVVGVLLAVPSVASAADPTGDLSEGDPLTMVWLIVCSAIVFFMQGGFAMLEAGMSRTKNVVNVLMKNLVDYSAGAIGFFVIGYALLMGTDSGGLIGTDGFMLLGDFYDVDTGLIWIFMLVFAAASATIVSGAIAERTKFSTYVVFSVVITSIIYPIYGHWVWGGGWMMTNEFLLDLSDGLGHLDFAGSGVVHAVGGYLALAAAIIIGPRIGRFGKNGEVRAMPGHNMTLAALGTFILWFAWFGFNCGSTLDGTQLRISIIAINTNLSAAAGAVVALGLTWYKFGKADIAFTMNGALGGLVGITAGCAWVAPWAAVIIGAIAGLIACYGYWLLERRGIDDVVGAIPVHGFNGTWGLIALGIFADGTYGVYTTEGPLVSGLIDGNPGFLAVQLIGALINIAYAFGVGMVLFTVLKKLMGVRVSREEELEGLDICEHGALAYPEMVTMDLVLRED